MKIVIQGHQVETTEIWDIEHICNTREVWVIIKATNKPNINIGRKIPYETCTGQFGKYWDPYKKLYNEIKAQWDADKINVPVFKLDN